MPTKTRKQYEAEKRKLELQPRHTCDYRRRGTICHNKIEHIVEMTNGAKLYLCGRHYKSLGFLK